MCDDDETKPPINLGVPLVINNESEIMGRSTKRARTERKKILAHRDKIVRRKVAEAGSVKVAMPKIEAKLKAKELPPASPQTVYRVIKKRA